MRVTAAVRSVKSLRHLGVYNKFVVLSVNISIMSTNVTRESVLALMEEKERIESEINQMKTILDSNHHVGMTESLVDADGFPRQDVDVYQVRHARHRIICLMNDHKAIMKRIEEDLNQLHLQQRDDVDMMETDSIVPVQHTEPIARVNFVATRSPAEDAGICMEDLIVEFGSVNATNFKSLQDIGTVVHHSQGKPVVVRVKRDGTVMKLSLTPRPWEGRGLLGCNIVPVEHVER